MIVVLHIIVDLSRHGAEMMLYRLIAAHRDHPEVQHKVISLRSLGAIGPDLQALGVEVEWLGMRKSLADTVRVFRQLSSSIRRHQPDIVQTWMYHADLLGGLAARRAGQRNIIWGVRIAELSTAMGIARSTIAIRRVCAFLSRWIPRRIVYVAESARRAHEAHGYDPSKAVVIHNGYRIPSETELAEGRARRRRELGLSEDQLLVGSAGRFSPQKGYRGFVLAAAELARDFPDLRFAIIGHGVGWENAELAGWIRASGLEERFHLLGERTDIHEWLAALDVFVLNSLGEGFPNVVAEAMSVQVPTIVTDVGDSALLVDDTGIIITSGDTDALAAAIRRLAGGDGSHRRQLGKAARRRVASSFAMSGIARRFEALYEELLAAPAGAAATPEGVA